MCVVVVDSGVKTIHNVFLSFSSSISPKSARVCVCVVVVDSEWCVQTTHKSSSFLYTNYEMVHQTGVFRFLSLTKKIFSLSQKELEEEMSYGGKGIPLHSISTSSAGNRSGSSSSSTEYDSSESSDDDLVGAPPPMLPRRGKTYAKLVADNSDLIKKKPPMPRRGNTYASLVGRKNDLLKGGRVRSAVVKSPRTNTRPGHQRKSTGSILTDDTMKPPPLPPRKSSRNDTPIKASKKNTLSRTSTPPLKSEPIDELPIVYVANCFEFVYFQHTHTQQLYKYNRWVNLNPSPGLKVKFPTGKWKVRVPKGRTGGQRLRITLSEDTDVRVLIPEGLKPGDKFLVRHNSVAQFDTFASSQSGNSSFSSVSSNSSKKRSIAPLELTSSKSFEEKMKQRFDRLRGLHVSVTTWNVENTSPSQNAISAVCSSITSNTSNGTSVTKCTRTYQLTRITLLW